MRRHTHSRTTAAATNTSFCLPTRPLLLLEKIPQLDKMLLLEKMQATSGTMMEQARHTVVLCEQSVVGNMCAQSQLYMSRRCLALFVVLILTLVRIQIRKQIQIQIRIRIRVQTLTLTLICMSRRSLAPSRSHHYASH